MSSQSHNSLVVLGPTASGKTSLACELAFYLGGEIISADSRQVYKGLDIGTGKDLKSYVVQGHQIKHHLIDIADPGEQFFLHQYIEALETAFADIVAKKKLPVICGGTGLYLDALHKDFSLTQIDENPHLREALAQTQKEELIKKLREYPLDHVRHVDVSSTKRLIRGIEVAEFLKQHPDKIKKRFSPFRPFYIGIEIETSARIEAIGNRLLKRIDDGLIEEVEGLLNQGLSHERLQQLGLEYKYLSLYLQKKLNREEMISALRTAIIQYSKRQMTWFRKMEKEGIVIHWIKKDRDPRELSQELKSEFFNG